jgi:hypothetical protein
MNNIAAICGPISYQVGAKRLCDVCVLSQESPSLSNSASPIHLCFALFSSLLVCALNIFVVRQSEAYRAVTAIGMRLGLGRLAAVALRIVPPLSTVPAGQREVEAT